MEGRMPRSTTPAWRFARPGGLLALILLLAVLPSSLQAQKKGKPRRLPEGGSKDIARDIEAARKGGQAARGLAFDRLSLTAPDDSKRAAVLAVVLDAMEGDDKIVAKHAAVALGPWLDARSADIPR